MKKIFLIILTTLFLGCVRYDAQESIYKGKLYRNQVLNVVKKESFRSWYYAVKIDNETFEVDPKIAEEILEKTNYKSENTIYDVFDS